MKKRKIELLAPAKDCLTAIDAVNYGADAVYMGASGFGARFMAANTEDDIARAAEYAHVFGSRVYVTMNTVLFDSELDEARNIAMNVVRAGADALIVQDMAYCRMNLPVALHASTQTSASTVERARFLSEVGFSRIVLERSLDLSAIASISHSVDSQIECFVHGALCVSESGKCFLSRSMSPRSGNRGQCSQPCRLTYDLEDEKGSRIITSQHLLSLHDLNLSSRLEDLIDAGVTSFKIEGRLKDRDYVRNVVSYYNTLLNRIIESRDDVERASYGYCSPLFVPNPEKSFSRGFTLYYLDGKKQGAASFSTPKSMGERIGKVKDVKQGRVVLDSDAELGTGDGVCFISKGKTYGTTINAASHGMFVPNVSDGIEKGTVIYRNLDRKFVGAVLTDRTERKINVDFTLLIYKERAVLKVCDHTGVRVEVSKECIASSASDPERVSESYRTVLAKTGNTPFTAVNIIVPCDKFVPISVISSLRREALELLVAERRTQRKLLPKFVENKKALLANPEIEGNLNVTNSVAQEFYKDHGAKKISPGIDILQSTVGEKVLTTDYCIRREIGQCLREHPSITSNLYLCHGRYRYRLDFLCNECKMTLTHCSSK